ncbi:hypothetical protein [Deinococcus sp.]|uniref:hypothetical protein n=1 Tax=Deinococcus sp. TaxID=47478 RepID=UPI003C7D79DE
MGVTSYGIWRKASLVLIPAGIVHLGIADGLFNRWVGQKNYRISLTGYLRILLTIFILSLCYTLIAYRLGYFDSKLFFFIALVVFNYGVYSVIASYIQSHSDERLYPLYFLMQPVILLVTSFGFIWVFGHKIQSEYFLLGYFISFVIPSAVVSLRVVGGQQKLRIKELLHGTEQGMSILTANILLLVSMNIDKLMLGHFASKETFGSYSLLSALPFAASTVGYPIGLALYARGFARNIIKYAGLALSVSGAVVFYIFFKIFEDKINNIYSSFNFQLLPIFLCTAVVLFILSMAYFPARRSKTPRIFVIECFLVATLIAIAILIWHDTMGNKPYIYIISFGSVFLFWIIYIESHDYWISRHKLDGKM